MAPNVMGMFGRPSVGSLRINTNAANSSTGSNAVAVNVNASVDATAPRVDQLNNRIQLLEMRVCELGSQYDEQVKENRELLDEIRRLEQAKADHQIRHAMRVSDLEHRLMVMKQQLWVAGESSSTASTVSGPPPYTGVAPSPPGSSSSGPASGLSPTPHRPSASLSTLSAPSAVQATLDAERTRRTELESQVASLRTQLNDERRRHSTRDRQQRGEKDEAAERLGEKDKIISAQDTEIRRLTSVVASQNSSSVQRSTQLERQLDAEKAKRQQDARLHQAAISENEQAMQTLRQSKQQCMTAQQAAERQVRQLKAEVTQRGAQLEYYQQRLLRTAEFRLVKTPFEVKGEEKEVVEATVTNPTPKASPSPSPEPEASPASSTPTPTPAIVPIEVAA